MYITVYHRQYHIPWCVGPWFQCHWADARKGGASGVAWLDVSAPFPACFNYPLVN